MSKSYNYQPAGELTVSTTGNITDLDVTGCGLVRMANASLATIKGIKEGFEGQRVTILSDGAGEVDLAHQDTGEATSTRRLFNFITSGITPLAAGLGRATYVYSRDKGCWCLTDHAQGGWITPTYAAGNFTASGAMTWTVDAGDITAWRYYVTGRVFTTILTIETTTVGGVLDQGLYITIPNSYQSATLKWTLETWGWDNNVETQIRGNVVASGTTMRFYRYDIANWSASVNLTYIYGGFTFELV